MSREIVIGVCGGISAYKTATLVSRLVQVGHGVSVVMTRSAREFVGPTTFEALTGRRVPESMFAGQGYPLGAHIELARRADLLCVAPATANLLAKAACGLADDLLTAMLLSFTGETLLAPAMNNEMWQKPAVQRNVQTLRADGFQIVGPEEGWLSCRETGPGRMAEPETILAAIEQRLAG